MQTPGIHLFMSLAAAAVLTGFAPEARAEEAKEGPDVEATGEESLPPGTELYGSEPVVPVPTDELYEMSEDEPGPHRMMVRASLWLPYWQTTFRLGAGATTFSIEDKFDVPFPIAFSLPLEGYIRTRNQEFRLRYVWWRYSYTGDPVTMTFGDATFSADRVRSTLETQMLAFDFLQRILDKPRFDIYLSAGIDLFTTSLKLSGAAGSDALEETVPILPVGLGVRFNVRPDVSVFLAHSALSYAQVLWLDEEFFGNKDTYRNFEVSVVWEKGEKLDLGAGLRYCNVHFSSNRLEARQEMTGASCWVRFKF